MKWYKIGREFVYPDYKPMFPRDPEYKLLSVDLELKLNFMERRAFGKVLHKVEALTNISSIKLDAVDMEITSVHVNGKDVDFSYDGSVLEIYP
ncbi:MAG TPA: aminopeptidase, partial [Thermoprotei archaeon]|nr:aminopeptidase [Thermoprotei archaeon]